MNQAHVVCLPSQASSHPLARGRALLGRACQEQFLAPARQPPVSAGLHQNTECAELHWLGCMVNALHRNDQLTMTICCSEAHIAGLFACTDFSTHHTGIKIALAQLHVQSSTVYMHSL